MRALSSTLCLGVQHQEEEYPQQLTLKASGARLQELHRIGGNRDFTLGGRTPGPRAKAETPQEPGPELPAGLGRSPVEGVPWRLSLGS